MLPDHDLALLGVLHYAYRQELTMVNLHTFTFVPYIGQGPKNLKIGYETPTTSIWRQLALTGTVLFC